MITLALKLLRSIVVTLLALPLFAAAGLAQDYPSRLITLVVPYPAGGGLDVFARMLAKPLGGASGQVRRDRQPARRWHDHRRGLRR